MLGDSFVSGHVVKSLGDEHMDRDLKYHKRMSPPIRSLIRVYV